MLRCQAHSRTPLREGVSHGHIWPYQFLEAQSLSIPREKNGHLSPQVTNSLRLREERACFAFFFPSEPAHSRYSTVPTLTPSALQHLGDICSLVLAYIFLLLIPSIFLGSALVFVREEVAHSTTTQCLKTRAGRTSWGTAVHTTAPGSYAVHPVHFANDKFDSHINKPRLGCEACGWASQGGSKGRTPRPGSRCVTYPGQPLLSCLPGCSSPSFPPPNSSSF